MKWNNMTVFWKKYAKMNLSWRLWNHTIAETFLKSGCKKMIEIVQGSETVTDFKIHSDDKINSWVIDMSNDIVDIMKEIININLKFSLQINESTNISACVQLLAYILYIDGDVMQLIFFFKDLPKGTTRKKYFMWLTNMFPMMN